MKWNDAPKAQPKKAEKKKEKGGASASPVGDVRNAAGHKVSVPINSDFEAYVIVDRDITVNGRDYAALKPERVNNRELSELRARNGNAYSLIECPQGFKP